MKPRGPKVLMAMSGGVDSSVGAALLVREGYEVVGCFMRLGSPGDSLREFEQVADECGAGSEGVRIGKQGCCSINDAADARLVAAELGIPFYVCNFKKDFGRIIDYFADEYVAGRTPNPCVRCNDWLKFGKLHDYATQIGASFVASGHYARVAGDPPRLRRGADGGKDQSYVLFGVPRERLGQLLFPVGGMPKSEVRDTARKLGLPVFDKPDSQEICFVPDQDYAGLVERVRPGVRAQGRVVDEAGNTLGTHDGQHRFTIGQRRGVGVAAGVPLYVLRRDPRSNTVTVGGRDALRAQGCIAGEANWLVDPPEPGQWRAVRAKYRYNTPAAAGVCRVLPAGSASTPSGRTGRFEVRFESPQAAVAGGQAVVLYDATEPDLLLGGGWIESVAGEEKVR